MNKQKQHKAIDFQDYLVNQLKNKGIQVFILPVEESF